MVDATKVMRQLAGLGVATPPEWIFHACGALQQLCLMGGQLTPESGRKCLGELAGQLDQFEFSECGHPCHCAAGAPFRRVDVI